MRATRGTALLLLCLTGVSETIVAGFSINSFRVPPRSSLRTSSYGRGAEIWPECNEDLIQLADSFPGGTIPKEVLDRLSPRSAPVDPELTDKKSYLPQPIRRILSRAQNEERQDTRASLDKTPTVIAIVLLLSGLVRPLDVMITAGISGYLAVLYYWASSPRADGISPHVPSLPPQGHVPDLVDTPLGLSFTNSEGYDSWLKVGAILSLFAPLAAILKYTVFAGPATQLDAAKACARPLFLLCCQAFVESFSRRVMVSQSMCVSCASVVCFELSFVKDSQSLTQSSL